MPEFEIRSVPDAYAYYVIALGISEDLFWNADLAFLEEIAANRGAYDSWVNARRDYEMMEAEERNGKG